ncbi:MAG: hypothetical protein O2894_04375 [Planctomycetota bacterium]|nr:hypothetical protein [Planctomycetota bacterium]
MQRLATLLAASAVLWLAACNSTGNGPSAGLMGEDRECTRRLPPVIRPGDQVPIYEFVEEPIFEDRHTPVYGHKTVDVVQNRKRPITWPTKDFCTGCEGEQCLWTVNEEVRVGIDRVPACIGYKRERVQVGTCRKKVLVGWRTVQPAPCACP